MPAGREAVSDGGVAQRRVVRSEVCAEREPRCATPAIDVERLSSSASEATPLETLRHLKPVRCTTNHSPRHEMSEEISKLRSLPSTSYTSFVPYTR